jgi:hypothetical protein
MTTEDLTALIHNGEYDPSEIILIGTHMRPWSHDEEEKNLDCGYMQIGSDFAHKLKIEARLPPKEKTHNGSKANPALALIYAYAYEGHTYRLPKPQIMIVNGVGEIFGSEPGKTAPSATDAKLFMWHLSKHDKTISIEVQSDTLEKLLLEGNQPGNRAVNSYAAHMQMSHRGGKLS